MADISNLLMLGAAAFVASMLAAVAGFGGAAILLPISLRKSWTASISKW